jgi:two-component system response regulator RegX3
MARILVVDDDPHLREVVRFALEREGHGVVEAADGAAALARFEDEPADLVVLDVLMPELDGLEVCRRLRARGPVPIVFLSSRDDELDRVLGLELGADDYLTKPFSPRELVARVKAILRRVDGPPRDGPTVIRLGPIEVDLGRREARVDGQVVALAAREFELLQYFAENRGLALTRRQLLDGVWGHDWVGDERTVDVHVRQLRKKLGDGLELATVWGVGYRLD